MAARIPVTVLTGYLGAGKTTLLNRILSADRGKRYAVVVNEFGTIGIDNDLIIGSDEELFTLSNGCVCCTIRGDLIRTLHELLGKRADFDGIVVETTGLADPGPVAQTFFVDQFLAARTVLDSVTTLVDAKHILLRLDDSREAREQIAFADQIVLNKTELVDAAELRAIEARLRRINPLAPIHRAERADVPLDKVLGRGGFDLERITALEPDFLDPAPDEAAHEHDAHCAPDHDHAADHAHDDTIGSVALTAQAPMDATKLCDWLADLVATRGQDILRAKGIIAMAGEDRRFVCQAVHMLLEGDLQRAWLPNEARTSRLVLIGRNLDAAALQAEFDACAADAGR